MDRSRWFGSARALAGVAADEAGWWALVTLADAAAAGCADAAELAEVFVPYLEQLAGRWPDHLRAASPRWIAALDARLSLARLLRLDSSTQLDALPAMLRWSPALRHLSVGAGVMHALPLLATLPPGHALDTLEIPLTGESRRVALDVVRDLPGWVERLVCVCGDRYHTGPPQLDGADISRLTLRGYSLAAGGELTTLIAALRGLPRLEALRGAMHPEARLLDAGNWGRLEGGDTLRVGCSSVSPALMREIVRVAASRDIRRVYIMPARLDMNALRVLLAAPLPGVERFGIKSSTLTEEDLGELEAWSGIRRLEALDLRGCGGSLRGSWALDRLRHEARALEVLRVDGDGV